MDDVTHRPRCMPFEITPQAGVLTNQRINCVPRIGGFDMGNREGNYRVSRRDYPCIMMQMFGTQFPKLLEIMQSSRRTFCARRQS